jgi:large subunit ribosomal protein L25
MNPLPTPLPARLLRFFTKFPPSLYSAKFTGMSYPLPKSKTPIALSAPPPDPLSGIQPSSQVQSNDSSETATPKTGDSSPTTSTEYPNPFLPWKNPETGRWRGPKFGLRRQAELVKLAKKYGVEPLLPPGRKSTEFKQQRALQRGLRVRGTGEGQTVKGHKEERTRKVTMEKREKAMEEMPEMIRLWKQVSRKVFPLHRWPELNLYLQRGHGRGWKKYPK